MRCYWPLAEQALAGGRQTHGIVRVGQTGCRSLHERSDYVHALLRHLEAVGFDGAPRLLGIDEQGRELLTYLPGEVVVRSPAWLSDARLDSAARLIRGFHDATAGISLAGDHEVVCHGDLSSSTGWPSYSNSACCPCPGSRHPKPSQVHPAPPRSAQQCGSRVEGRVRGPQRLAQSGLCRRLPSGCGRIQSHHAERAHRLKRTQLVNK